MQYFSYYYPQVGERVLVLEQHDVAGGSTHTFEDQGFTFDVGVHYIGEHQVKMSSWPCSSAPVIGLTALSPSSAGQVVEPVPPCF